MTLFSSAVEIAVELAILAIVFSMIEHWAQGIAAPRWYRRADLTTDLGYFLINATLGKSLQTSATVLAVLAIAILGGASMTELDQLVEDLMVTQASSLAAIEWRQWLAAQPIALQVLLGLLVADFMGYWGHRLFHCRPFWYLHAIHHSPAKLDWLSSVRVHPLDDICMAVLQVVPLLFIGFDPAVFIYVTPAIAVWSVLSHANVSWDFGPFKYLILSPRFHRWHHTSEAEGLDKNFAGLFPIYDLIFGTWYMPNKVPTKFGAGVTPVPAGLWQQLLYPFRKAKPGEPLAKDI